MEQEEIRQAVLKRYRIVSLSAKGCFFFPTGREGLLRLGYDPGTTAFIPVTAVESFCGVGNPFSLGAIQRGGSLLDVGCGSGVDLIIAASTLGRSGRAVGVEPTPEMAALASRSLHQAGLRHAGVVRAWSEDLPFADASFHVIISNGVVNLAADKESSFREMARVLRPQGRLYVADIVREAPRTEEPVSPSSWSR